MAIAEVTRVPGAAHEKGAGADALAPFVDNECAKFCFVIYFVT
jgi:hypothetical protein